MTTRCTQQPEGDAIRKLGKQICRRPLVSLIRETEEIQNWDVYLKWMQQESWWVSSTDEKLWSLYQAHLKKWST